MARARKTPAPAPAQAKQPEPAPGPVFQNKTVDRALVAGLQPRGSVYPKWWWWC